MYYLRYVQIIHFKTLISLISLSSFFETMSLKILVPGI